jgi:outer membrane protein assembly factor BamB
MGYATFVALVLAVLMPAESPAGWPQFRGVNGSGVAEVGSLPITLQRGESRVWSVEVPFGRSSPSVFGDRVVVTGSVGDRLSAFAYSRSTGGELWRYDVVRSRPSERLDRLNDPASPTPAIDASGVYVFFPDVGLIGLSLDGKEKWRLPLGPFRTAYGMASSPIVSDGLVIQACDQQQGSFLVAVDARAGRVRWKVDRPDMREGWYTPAVVPQPGHTDQRMLVVPGSARIEAFDVNTGTRLWEVAGSGAENLGTPLADGAHVYVNVRGFPTPAFETWDALRTRYDSNGDGRVSRSEVKDQPTYFEQFNYVDVDRDGFFSEAEWTQKRNAGVGHFGLMSLRLGDTAPTTPDVVWRFEKNLPYVPAPILYKGIIYMIKSGGIVTAVDASTGTLLTQARTADALGDYFASPVAGDDKVYFSSEEGKVTVMQAGRHLTVLKVNDLGEEIYSTPALVDGGVIVRTRAHLALFRSGARESRIAPKLP